MKCTMTMTIAAVVVAGVATAEAHAQGTLDSIKQRGAVSCGSSGESPGFGIVDSNGNWVGLDVDFCRALAAAIFDDPTKVHFVPLSPQDRFAALQGGQVDVLSRNVTATMMRDTKLGFDFPAIIFYDGQGFMVRGSLGVAKASELNGKSICVEKGTTSELNLADYFKKHRMTYKAVVAEDAKTLYDNGGCDAYTNDMSSLYGFRLNMTKSEDHVILPDIISKEPLGPAVRHGDNQWGDIVKFTHVAMLNAEELGVTKTNVEAMKQSGTPEIKRLLGVEGDLGSGLGLSNDWAFRVIKHIGNYGEMYERNVGENTPLKIKRGKNELWTNGGLQYGVPIR